MVLLDQWHCCFKLVRLYFMVSDSLLHMSAQALVDAPDMVRSQMNFKRLSLTDIKIDIKRVPKKKELLAAMEAAGRFWLLWKVVDIVFHLVYLPFETDVCFAYRCKEEVGEQLMGKKIYCSEEKGISHWLWKVQAHVS